MTAAVLALLVAVAPRAVTLDDVVQPARVAGVPPASPAWSPDGARLAFLWSDAARPPRAAFVVERSGKGLRRLGTESGREVSDLAWTPDGAALLTLEDGDLWLTSVGGGEGRRLTSDGGGKSELAISPDGRFASWLRDGDVWLIPLGGGESRRPAAQGGEPRRLTSVGVPPLAPGARGTYARPDVEIGAAFWTSPAAPYRWSPDGKRIAVHLVDRRQVRRVTFPTYAGEAAGLYELRRPVPGDPNEDRRVALVDVEAGRLTDLDLPLGTGMAVVTMEWSPGGVLLVDRATDDMTEREVFLHDPTAARTESLWMHYRESRIYTDFAAAWHPDGERVVLTSDLAERDALWAFTRLRPEPSGPGLTLRSVRAARLTPVEFDVTGPARPIWATGDLLYVSAEPVPSERHVWRLPAGGGPRVRVTTRPGHHEPFPSPDGGAVATLSSDDVTPPELWIGEVRVTRSPPAGGPALVRPRYVTFPSRDGRTLHARILEPPGLARGARAPTVFGPMYTNTVRNRWGGTWGLLQQHLATAKGFRVVQVDVRGSTGYGRAFREAFLMDHGGRDLDDLEDAVRWLARQPGVDPARVGVFGSSYGGTLTLHALFKRPGLFAAGVAGAPATDPRWFGPDDVAITRTPTTFPEAFERGQLARYAGGLSDPLLIVHGMADDVVPFKTTVDLAGQLVRLGKDFELAAGPTATHAWSRGPEARHLLGRLVEFLERHLHPAGKGKAAAPAMVGARPGSAPAAEVR